MKYVYLGLALSFNLVSSLPVWAQKTPQTIFLSYTNLRFNYRVAYPADFTPQGESDNGDGQVFLSTDNAKLIAWGGFNVTKDTPSKAVEAEMRRGDEQKRKVTYKFVGKSFFVLSGYEADGQQIFYIKRFIYPDRHFGFEFIYPVQKRERYDRDVKFLSNSLRRL